ncbi:MAG: B12-binding domain-containing radical SAM protein [Elusimicrobiales bacterium]|nr:B12-binding domain-containing radical SAM protein [Elusimicrobiales bacterium]
MTPRILLIKAKVNKSYQNNAEQPLGLLYISSSIKQNGYTDVKLFEAEKYPYDYEEKLLEVLKEYNPDFVGISAITAESLSVHRIADIVKKFNKKIFVNVGGPYPTYYPESCINDSNIDFLVIKEGEIVINNLLDFLFRGINSLDMIKGLVFKKEGRAVFNEPEELIANLDDIPLPDWGLIDFDSYREYVPQTPFLYGKRYATIMTSRGCPYHCTYCHDMFGKNFRMHSPKRVIDEIRILHNKYGIDNIEILDDIFNLDIKRAKTILIEKQRLFPDVKLFFVNGLRGDILDDELIKLFKLSNTKYICLALETGSPRIQKLIKKNLDLEKLVANTRKIVKQKIFVNLYVMFNFPSEIVTDVYKTIKLLIRTKAHTFMPSYLIVYNNTKISEIVDKKNVIRWDNDKLCYTSILDFINYSDMKRYQLIFLKTFSNIIFYFFFPLRWYRIIRDMPYRDFKIIKLLFKKLLTRTIILK